ncbi:MAG: hypothetical protein K9L59_13000 [Desulfobacterales bacterium]|nr:hypothetical protein [Desulfobacterales bacterium]
MTGSRAEKTPCRVTDLANLKTQGSKVSCRTEFEILTVDFHHQANPFQAVIFLCRYTGEIDGNPYKFRKCYARGCPHNLCPHVSQAVMIANRYLQRDYHRLEQAGIDIDRRLFSLEEMTVKFEGAQEAQDPILSIHDYIHMADEGTEVTVDPTLEWVTAVEHFAHQKTRTMFLMADFAVTCFDQTHHFDRCLACYPEDREQKEKQEKIDIANERLKLLYEEFALSKVRCEERFFSA